MIHPTRKYSSLLCVVLASILVSCAGHAATLVLGYGGSTTTSGVGVYPQDASANSERYFRCIVGLASTESLVSLRISGGVSGQTQLFPDPNGALTPDVQAGVTRYVVSSGSTTYTAWTIGPYAGFDIFGAPHAPSNVIGQVGGFDGTDIQFTFSATVVTSSGDASPSPVTGVYRTNADNADILEWFSGNAAGVDPLSVLDSPTPGIDNGSSSNTYRLRVQYKIPGERYALNLPPRFGTPGSPPGPWATFADFDAGRVNAVERGDRTGNDWWTYDPGSGNNSTTPYNQSPTYPREDDFGDINGYYGTYSLPEVVLIIDGDRSRPHYMQREDASDTNARDANGLRFFYDLVPTDYMNLMDHLFLFPYASPGPDPQDLAAINIHGRPVSNNYVGMQVGGHIYEFICSDDFSPPDNNNVWLQVGHPGSAEYNDYMKPIVGSGGQMQSNRVFTRFSDSDGAGGGYGYPYNSQDPTQYPNVNPMLTAHPFFPRGAITPYASDASMTVNPPGAAPDPFTAEVGAGPNPPARITNDDTILPNYVNIRPNTDPTAPFRGGKWTSASSYTLRVNYWQSANLPPGFMRVLIRKNNDGASPNAPWTGFTMEKANPADSTYTDGVVYQYVTTPDQLPGGGGPGDYNYQFVTSDGIRQATFPNRPARYEYQGGWLDPADIGVPIDPQGENDYYAFRVNQPPVLSAQSVNPASGNAGDNFQFKVTYTDADGEMLNPTAQGDRPFQATMYLDLFGNPQGEGRVVSVQNETTLTYTNAGGPGYAANELTGKAVEILTGVAAGKRYLIVSNTATQIVLNATPPTADPAYDPGRLLSDGVTATQRFRIAEWFKGTMLPANAGDLNYSDGNDYLFNSATNVVLGAGVHRYHFVFRDDWGSWLFPNDSNVMVEGEQVRFPFTGEFEGPEVLPNTPPVLTDYRFTPDALTGPDGTTATAFVLSVTYTDEENQPPALIRLGIDGTNDAPAIVLNLGPDNPSNPDQVFTDGAIYKTPPVKLAEGQHIVRAQASDGSGRYPVSQPGDPFLFAGPPSNPSDPSSAPLDHVDGPLVTSNTPPTLSFEATDNGSDPGNPPGLDPNTGRVITEFTYRVIYTDTDRFAGVAGNPPDYVRVFIDGSDEFVPNVKNDMTKVNPSDNDYTDGVLYEFKVVGLQEGTPHRYWFVASDGLDRARRPLVGVVPSYYSGPIVDEPPGEPQSLLAQDHPNDNGGVIDLTFNASQDDGGGAGDVTEYRIYRSESAGTYTDPPVATIAASGSPTYNLSDLTAVTGTDYFYVVRAWDGANESIDSNEEGPVSAIDNIPPQPPSNVTVADPGLGGTIRVSWNLSPDDGGGQNDVTEYLIFRATTATSFAPPPVGRVPAGTSTFDDTSATDLTDYFYMVRAFDGANESVDSNVAGPIQSTDQEPPVIFGLFPANRAVDVPVDTNISFIVTDTGTGVDRNNLTVAVTVGGAAVPGTLDITGTPARYTVTFDPDSDFDTRVVVNVDVDAQDLGGKTASKSWRFTIAGDPTYSISGTIRDTSNQPKAGVVVTAGNLSGTSDALGNYTIAGLINGTYTVTPKLTGFAFTPTETQVNISDASVSGVDFIWEPAFDIRGRVVDEDGEGVQGVTISEGTRTAISDANGYWRLRDLPAGDYNVIPSLSRYVFEPQSQLVTIGPTATGVIFVASLQTFGVSGIITDLNGKRLEAVNVAATGNGPKVEAVTNASGQYTLTGLLPGQWTITPRKAEFIFRPIAQTVDVDVNITEVNFVGVPIYTLQLPAGLSFLGLPILPEDTKPTSVFGAAGVWRYNPALPGYVAGNVNPSAEFVQVKPGRGFWVRSAVGTVLNVAGTPQPNNQTAALQLLDGWNMLGNPYSAVLPWANVGVTEGGPVRDFAYIWDPSRNYILVSDAPGVGGETNIPQNAAMWMRATGTRTVLISPVSATAASRHEAWTRSEGEFVIPIHAAAGGTQDTTARAGVVNYAAAHPEAYEIENPPAQEQAVDVYFTSQDGRLMTCDVRGATANSLSYNFSVKTDLQNVPVKVSLPDLSQVPRDKSVILIDVASGKRLWARTLNNYTYNSGQGGERRFRLEIAPSTGGGLSVAITPAAAKSGGMAISYTLSRPASVQMVIMNLSGRTIRTVTRDKSAQPGLNTEAWDLRSDTGAKVPTGRYLVRVQASADDGQQVSAVAPLMVQ